MRGLAIQAGRQFERFRQLPRWVSKAAREVVRARPNQRLADVEVKLHRFEAILPARLELKDVAPDFGREAQTLEFARAGFERIGQFGRPIRRPKMRNPDTALRIELGFDHAVEPTRAVRARLPVERQARILAAARTKAFGRDILRS